MTASNHFMCINSFNVLTAVQGTPILIHELHNSSKVMQLLNLRTRLRTLKVALKNLYILFFENKRKVVMELLDF